jgi:uncharacterized cupin superfamily protein
VADSRRAAVNVFDDEWEELFPAVEGWRSNTRRIAPGAKLGMSIYELLPGQTQCPYHFHHGSEELVLVLRGRPTLRTPSGESELREGDAVHFTTGPEGAHQIVNRTDEPVRYVVAAAHATPEIVEYPDSGKFGAGSREHRFWSINRTADAVDYLDGEQPHA